MFREESLEYTMKAFADFLYQRCGGGSQFTDRRGFISISELHSQYEISVEMVEKWCDVMEEAMYRMKSDFNEDHRQQILDYLRYQGYEIIVWAKYKKLLKKRGPLFWLDGYMTYGSSSWLSDDEERWRQLGDAHTVRLMNQEMSCYRKDGLLSWYWTQLSQRYNSRVSR